MTGESAKVRAERMKGPVKTVLSRERYDRLLEAYRQWPGNASRAAHYAGVDWRSAKRAWEDGWRTGGNRFGPGRPIPWARPIREVLAEEALRAESAALEAERARAAADAAEAERRAVERQASIDEERRVMSAVRRDVLAAAVVVGSLVKGMTHVARVVERAVLDPVTGEPLAVPGINPLQAMRLLKDFTSTSTRLAYAASEVVKMGRLDRGQSTETIFAATAILSPEAIAEELQAGERISRRLREEALRTRDLREEADAQNEELDS